MEITEHIIGREVYFDTNIFIYAFEGYPKYSQLIQTLFAANDQERYTTFTSELTLAELLVKPLADNNKLLVDTYLNTLPSTQGLNLLPISRAVLIAAAKLRATIGSQVKLPDAIHLASALEQGCSTFVTNDKRLKAVQDIVVVVLDDFIPTGS